MKCQGIIYSLLKIDFVVKYVEQIAYILILVSAGTWMWMPQYSPWLMAAGGIGVTINHLYEKYGAANLRQRRNRRLRHLLGLVYLVTAYFMYRQTMEWVVALLIAVVIELYTLFVASRHEE